MTLAICVLYASIGLVGVYSRGAAGLHFAAIMSSIVCEQAWAVPAVDQRVNGRQVAQVTSKGYVALCFVD